jgi:hypothetical protein
VNKIPKPQDLSEPAGAALPEASNPIDGAPSLPAIVASTFDRLNIRLRARMLGRLLASVGPLALAVVGGGAFAKYVTQARWPEIPVSFEDAARATSSQIYDIVRYVQQSNPQLFGHLLDVLARDTATIAALSASIAALGINSLATRGRGGEKVHVAAPRTRTRRKPKSGA